MYTIKNVKQHPHKHTLAILANDEPGVLTRITGMFLKRNFNINTITAGHSTHPGISRITITFFGDDRIYDQMVKQLSKLIDVIKVADLHVSDSVIRELALLKVKAKDLGEQNQIMNYCHAYRARVVNINTNDVSVEITGRPEKIDAFYELVSKLGVVEIARSGITAMHRNYDDFEDLDKA